MEFRLTYEGKLLGASRSNTRPEHKHKIRKVFHKQLKRFWRVHPYLQYLQTNGSGGSTEDRKLTGIERTANRFTRCGHRFVPLVQKELNLLCSIEILFLRPTVPGMVMRGGDIDNRLKTIFDALKMPRDASELGGNVTPETDEDPFFCLLEDDSLITHISVETDMLLEPIGTDLEENDARLILTVRIGPYASGAWETMGYG